MNCLRGRTHVVGPSVVSLSTIHNTYIVKFQLAWRPSIVRMIPRMGRGCQAAKLPSVKIATPKSLFHIRCHRAELALALDGGSARRGRPGSSQAGQAEFGRTRFDVELTTRPREPRSDRDGRSLQGSEPKCSRSFVFFRDGWRPG